MLRGLPHIPTIRDLFMRDTWISCMNASQHPASPQRPHERRMKDDLLDHFDLQILALLQTDASLSAAEIGERIGLSQSPCWRRINRLERDGYLTARVALLDRHRLGLDVLVFALVKLTAHGRRSLPEFAEAIRERPEVLECFTLLGDMDFLLRIVVPDIQAYERFFFETLSQLPGVQEVHSNIAMSEMKSTTSLPL